MTMSCETLGHRDYRRLRILTYMKDWTVDIRTQPQIQSSAQLHHVNCCLERLTQATKPEATCCKANSNAPLQWQETAGVVGLTTTWCAPLVARGLALPFFVHIGAACMLYSVGFSGDRATYAYLALAFRSLAVCICTSRTTAARALQGTHFSFFMSLGLSALTCSSLIVGIRILVILLLNLPSCVENVIKYLPRMRAGPFWRPFFFLTLTQAGPESGSS